MEQIGVREPRHRLRQYLARVDGGERFADPDHDWEIRDPRAAVRAARRRALSILYLDASAITKLVIDEPETSALQEVVRGHDVVSSRVAAVEVVKAVARANPDADPSRVFAMLAFVELDAELATLAGATGEPGLRALDAIHVASAQRLGSDVGAFLTYDARQATAARAAGLSVEMPGASQA